MKIGAVTVDDIAALVRDLEKGGAAPSTIQNHLLPLQGTFAFALRRGLIDRIPMDAFKRRHRAALAVLADIEQEQRPLLLRFRVAGGDLSAVSLEPTSARATFRTMPV